MFDWLKKLLGKKVDTSPEIPESAEPTLREVLVRNYLEKEDALRKKANTYDSITLRAKIHAQADMVRDLRREIEEQKE